MSPESQRVALAELCPNLCRASKTGSGILFWKKDQAIFDPIRDLNALRGVIDSLDVNQAHRYAVILGLMLFPNGWTSWEDTLAVANASAATHSEAILKACGKWVEAK